MRGSRAVAGLLLCSSLFAPLARGAGGEEGKPLPVDKSQRLLEQGAALYTVEGRVRIPRGVELTVMKNTRVLGKGASPAVLEVEGSLNCIGTFGHEVVLENLTVEPCAKFDSIHMDMAIFKGSGGPATPKDRASDGYLFLENTDITGSCAMDVVFQAGKVMLSSDCSDAPVRIRCVPPPGKDRDQVTVFIRGCPQDARVKCTPHGGRVGLVGGLEVKGGDDVTVQLSRIGGALCSVSDWGQRLLFVGNKVNSVKLEFAQAKPGMFQKVQCSNCDVYSSEVWATAPVDPKQKDTLNMDRAWFHGLKDPKEIQEKVIHDGSDAPDKDGVRVALLKVEERAHELAGPADK